MRTPHWSKMSTPKPGSPLDEVTQWATESLTAGATKGNIVGKLCESGWPRKTAAEVVKEELEGLAQEGRVPDGRQDIGGRNGSTTSSRLHLSAGGIVGHRPRHRRHRRRRHHRRHCRRHRLRHRRRCRQRRHPLRRPLRLHRRRHRRQEGKPIPKMKS